MSDPHSPPHNPLISVLTPVGSLLAAMLLRTRFCGAPKFQLFPTAVRSNRDYLVVLPPLTLPVTYLFIFVVLHPIRSISRRPRFRNKGVHEHLNNI